MLAKKERIAWVVVVLLAITSTFFITSNSISTAQNTNAEILSTKVLTDIEGAANQWFTSIDSPMPRRDFYTELKSYDPLLIYQGAIDAKEIWINYPEQIAWRAFLPPPEIEGFVPTQTSIYFYNTDIQSVLITLIGRAGVGATENRTDFVKVDNVWKIVWAGQRSIMLK